MSDHAVNPDPARTLLRAEDFVELVKKDIKALKPSEIAGLIDFLTIENLEHWECVLGEIGFVVNVPGRGAFPDASYTLRLIDAKDRPELSIYQYDGLDAHASRSRSRRFLDPCDANQEVFGAFGRFLTTTAILDSPDSKRRPRHM